MKTTVSGEVNMYSPHIGQLHFVERSIHLCVVSIDMGIHTQQVCREISQGLFQHQNRIDQYLAVEKILPKSLADTANTTIIAVIYTLLIVIIP